MSSPAESLRAKWKSDSEASQCEKCAKEFGIFRRRHHCRQCGGLYCSDCCIKTSGVPGYDGVVLVCSICKDLASQPQTQSLQPHNVARLRARERKVCLLGRPAVGKTAIVRQMCEHNFDLEYKPSAGGAKSVIMKQKGVEYSITLVDTAGQTDADLFQPQYTIGTDAYLLVYSLDDSDSLRALDFLHNKLLDYIGEDVVIIVVQNKSDLPANSRVINPSEGPTKAAAWKVPYFEVSARQLKSVEVLFQNVLKEIVERGR